MSDTTPNRKRRLRFSLLNLLLMMTIVAMAVALWQLNGELVSLRTEVAGHRQMLGFLSIPPSEKDKIHAMKLESEEENEWRYRIYLPEGRSYGLRFASGVLPARTADNWGFKNYAADVAASTSWSVRTWEPGEFVLSFRVRRKRDPADPRENWVFETRRVGEGSKGSTTLTMPWMADRRAWSHSRSMVGNEQKAFDPSEPLSLLTVRESVVTELPRGGHTAAPADQRQEANGFMLWFESP